MAPFDFIILFFSFIYTLGLTHILFAATRMVRHRRGLIFSWPHALWMFNALMLLIANWISLYDFHRQEVMPIATIATGVLFSFAQYFICALVSPDFDDGETLDLRTFHDREGRTYITAFALLILLALVVNTAATFGAGVENWGRQNAIVLAMLPAALTPLFVKARWAQLSGPLVVAILLVIFIPLFYPVLAKG